MRTLRNHKLLVVGLCALATSTAAEPVYMTCTHSGDGEPHKTYTNEVMLNRESGKITHTNSTGSAFNANALLSSDYVKYSRTEKSGNFKVVMNYSINRSDLTYEVQAMIIDNKTSAAVGEPSFIKGQCTVIERKNRQI